jgi:hypothetical protein
MRSSIAPPGMIRSAPASSLSILRGAAFSAAAAEATSPPDPANLDTKDIMIAVEISRGSSFAYLIQFFLKSG